MIKIKQCSNKNKGTLEEWYKDKIGEEFEVYWQNAWYCWIRYINKKGAGCINVINLKDGEMS